MLDCLQWRARLPRLFTLLLALTLAVVPARAQDKPKPFEEQGITYLPRQDPYIQWIAGTVIVAACLAVAFKNPHRSHMD